MTTSLRRLRSSGVDWLGVCRRPEKSSTGSLLTHRRHVIGDAPAIADLARMTAAAPEAVSKNIHGLTRADRVSRRSTGESTRRVA